MPPHARTQSRDFCFWPGAATLLMRPGGSYRGDFGRGSPRSAREFVSRSDIRMFARADLGDAKRKGGLLQWHPTDSEFIRF